MKALVWNIWIARNEYIFNATIFICVTDVLLKCVRMMLYWFSTVVEGSREKLGDSMHTIKRSLEFLGQRLEAISMDSTAEEESFQLQG